MSHPFLVLPSLCTSVCISVFPLVLPHSLAPSLSHVRPFIGDRLGTQKNACVSNVVFGCFPPTIVGDKLLHLRENISLKAKRICSTGYGEKALTGGLGLYYQLRGDSISELSAFYRLGGVRIERDRFLQGSLSVQNRK